MRKFETSDPLRRGGRPVRRPVRPGMPLNGQIQSPGPSGAAASMQGPGPSMGVPGPGPAPRPMMGNPMGGPMSGPSAGPNSSSPNEEWKEFHLRACTSQELHDSRYHMVKFQSRQKVDIKEQFTPPIRFQRKDPKNLQLTVGDEEDEEEDRERRNPFFKKRKTHQVLGSNDEEGEAAKKLRQEEHYPWVMEDFDGSNAWVSSYEAAQSDTYVVFVFDHYGFKMIPVEKWYKMTSRNKFASLSLEQAEERMQKKDSGHNRWIMDRLQAENGVSGRGAQTLRRMRTVEGGEERNVNGEEMDYDEEFADDEEAPLIDGPEEDLKEVQDRIKKEQLQATHPSVAKDEDDDDLFGDDQEIDKQGKKLRRYLRSLEKNAYYDSDDDENPYASQSENDSEPEVKQEPDQPGAKSQTDAPPLVVFRRKNIKNLPHGMAVIQLPPNILRRFPEGEWNPRIARREAGSASPVSQSPEPTVASLAPTMTAAASASASPTSASSVSQYSTANTSDPTLLTSEDVREAISTHNLTITDLITALKLKLKQNKENKNRLRVILKEVAQVREGKLVLID